MTTFLRAAAVAVLVTASAAPALAQPKKDKPLPEPLPMGVPYVYQPGNPYWYAAAVPVYAPYYAVPVYSVYRVAPVTRPAVIAYAPVAYAPVAFPYPFASTGPVYGRYSWDYSGYYSNYGWYSTNMPPYPYSYQYPTITGRVWMGYGW